MNQLDSSKFKSILLFGPPGSGKGTIGKILSGAGNHYHLSSGDIFRGLSSQSPSGKLFNKYSSAGLLLPDEVTVQIWYNYLSGLISTNQYFSESQFLLLDGIPRTVTQANLLDQYIDVQHIIVLDVNNTDTLIKRIQGRAQIEGRSDDTDANVLEKRMKIYMEETSNVLNYYPPELITHFNGDQKPLEVLRDILSSLATTFSKV